MITNKNIDLNNNKDVNIELWVDPLGTYMYV